MLKNCSLTFFVILILSCKLVFSVKIGIRNNQAGIETGGDFFNNSEIVDKRLVPITYNQDELEDLADEGLETDDFDDYPDSFSADNSNINSEEETFENFMENVNETYSSNNKNDEIISEENQNTDENNLNLFRQIESISTEDENFLDSDDLDIENDSSYINDKEENNENDNEIDEPTPLPNHLNSEEIDSDSDDEVDEEEDEDENNILNEFFDSNDEEDDNLDNDLDTENNSYDNNDDNIKVFNLNDLKNYGDFIDDVSEGINDNDSYQKNYDSNNMKVDNNIIINNNNYENDSKNDEENNFIEDSNEENNFNEEEDDSKFIDSVYNNYEISDNLEEDIGNLLNLNSFLAYGNETELTKQMVNNLVNNGISDV